MAKKSIFSAKKTKNQARKKVSDLFFLLVQLGNPALMNRKKESGYEHFYFKKFLYRTLVKHK